jgi:hypothetical protein
MMNSHEERQSARAQAVLEAAIDRRLKALPELHAPRTLVPRVMAVIEQRAGVPWYRRAWQTWPMALQAGSLAVLLALFGGLCMGVWQLTHSAGPEAAVHEINGWLAALNMIERTLDVLGSALVLAVQRLGAGFIAACVLLALVCYAVSLGLGTVYVRLAMAKR